MNKDIKSKIKNFDYFIIDKDGTLVNSVETYLKTFIVLIEKWFRIPTRYAKEFFIHTSGIPLEIQVRELLKKYNQDISYEKFLEFKKEFYKIACINEVSLYNNAEEVLKILKRNNKKIFLSTGDREDTTIKMLKQKNIHCYFDKILSSDNIPKSEKHIYEFSKFVNEDINDFVKKSCYIGDGLIDIKIAKILNIFMVSVATTISREELIKEKPDLIINEVGDIIDYLI